MNIKKQPMQPIITDQNGYPRFQENKIVRYLLDNGGIDLNKICAVSAGLGFSQDDMEQFMQLIGYSLNGFSELSYVSDIAVETAYKIVETGKPEHEAKIEALENKLKAAREGMAQGVAELFGIHEDDLCQ